ncbi:hypothetical protein BGZ65_004467, partial [Modicella reniformis]
YRNFNSLIQLVMGLGCSHLSGLRRTWSRVGSYEMRVLEDLQYFISPCGNWRVLRKAMNKVGYHEVFGEGDHRVSHQATDNSFSPGTISAITARLQAPDSNDLQELLSTGTLLVHFYRFQLIAKTIKWFMAFQRRPQKYMFPVDSTLYSKCFLLRVLTNDRVRELADHCERE